MNKLEIKHLSPYLPYSLKVIMEGETSNVAWMSTKKIAVIRPSSMGELKKINWDYAHLNIKPILRPLSDLSKEMIIDGGKTTAAKSIGARLAKFYGTSPVLCKNDTPLEVMEWTVFEFQEAAKLHFDVFGLIDKGLAVDINTLEK